MFQSYKNRTLEPGQKVQVYRNLHNKLYSIRDSRSKLVLGHSPVVHIKEGEFIVQEAGRQRVLQTGQKNVHAWIEGTFTGTEFNTVPFGVIDQARYNPKQLSSFVDSESGIPLDKAQDIVITPAGVFYRP